MTLRNDVLKRLEDFVIVLRWKQSWNPWLQLKITKIEDGNWLNNFWDRAQIDS